MAGASFTIMWKHPAEGGGVASARLVDLTAGR